MATTTLESSGASPPPRKRRSPPERIAPVRQMTSVLRDRKAKAPAARPPAKEAPKNKPYSAEAARPEAAKAAPPEATTAAPADAGVTAAAEQLVRVGHELADAAIRRTRHRVGHGALPGSTEGEGQSEGTGRKDTLHLAETALRVWTELATGVFRAVFPLVPELVPDAKKIVDALRDLAGGRRDAKGAAGSQATSAPASFAVEVTSTQRVRVAFQLHQPAAPEFLAVQPLFAVGRDSGKPPITGVTLAPAKDGKGVEIHLAVPAEQPPGRYIGAVYDESTGTLAGGLTVDLGG